VSINPVQYEATTYRSRHVRRSAAARAGVVVAFILGIVATLAVAAGVQALADKPAQRGSTGRSATAAQSTPQVPSAAPVKQPKRKPVSKWKPTSSAEVPLGSAVPVSGTGSWRVVPGASGVVGTGPVRTYTVEIEDGVTLTEGDEAFGHAVQATLSDERSWISAGTVAWRRVDSGTPRLRILLASQETAHARCGYEIPIDVSCHDGGVVYLSAVRWIRGAVAFKGDLAAYRQYMVNHEVGHSIGKKHRPCIAAGGPAPVMMQQTFSTSNNEILKITAGYPQGVQIPKDGKVCAANPWPFP
jgi:hypothetical protein